MLVCQCLLIPGCVCVAVWLHQRSRAQTRGPALAAQRASPATTELCPSLDTAFSVSFAPPLLCTAGLHLCWSMLFTWSLLSALRVFFSFFSLTVLCRHSVESFPAALCKLHSQICRWSAVLHPRVWYHAPDTPLRRACQKDGEFSV